MPIKTITRHRNKLTALKRITERNYHENVNVSA